MQHLKALILAADHKDEIPSCFTLTVGAVSLLEHHLRILKLLGFNNEDICIVVGKGKIWQSLYSQIDSTYKLYKVDNLGKKSFVSLKKFCETNKGFIKGSLLILNANSFFELKDLEKLLQTTTSKALTFKINNTNITMLELMTQNNKILKVNDIKKIKKVPYYSFFGGLVLNQEDLVKIKNYNQLPNKAYIDVIVNDLKIHLDYVDISQEIPLSLEIIGGSFAGLSKMYLIKKSADILGNKKLIAEIKWLLALPQELKDKFPTIVDYKIGSENSYFTMPYYNLENLRKKILTGKFSTKESLYFLEKILEFCFVNLYSKKLQKAPKKWVFEKHFFRVNERIKKIQNIKPFDSILKAKYIIINKKKYHNLTQSIEKLYLFEQKYNFFAPKKLRMVHGDLHFQNMLIDETREDFILADPRGDKVSDIYYDLGKLWHSCNGLYDLIHTDIAKAKILHINKESAEFNLTLSNNENILQSYEDIKNGLFELIGNKFIDRLNDENWLLKIKFAEAMHFSSLMYFHLKNDGIENRSICLFLQAVVLTHSLLQELKMLQIGGGGGNINA